MDGPFYRGEKITFEVPVTGSPDRVHLVLKDPTGAETSHDCTYNATTGKWETDEIPMAVGGYWSKRRNVWRDTDTTSPATSDWEMFQVYSDPFTAPYAEP